MKEVLIFLVFILIYWRIIHKSEAYAKRCTWDKEKEVFIYHPGSEGISNRDFIFLNLFVGHWGLELAEEGVKNSKSDVNF